VEIIKHLLDHGLPFLTTCMADKTAEGITSYAPLSFKIPSAFQPAMYKPDYSDYESMNNTLRI